MRGFYIDIFPYPNEVGAIPTTEHRRRPRPARSARRRASASAPRLEIERACKGPANTAYEYGDTYKASVCATGIGAGARAERRQRGLPERVRRARSPRRRVVLDVEPVEARRGQGGPRHGARRQRRRRRAASVAAPTAAAPARGAPRGRGRALLRGRAQHLRGRALGDARRAAPLAARRRIGSRRSSSSSSPPRCRRARASGGPVQGGAHLGLAPARQRGAVRSAAAARARREGGRALRRR